MLGLGMGTPAPGETGWALTKVGSVVMVMGLSGDIAGVFEKDPCLDLAPGKPVKGLMTSETAEPRRGRTAGASLPADMDRRGDGRAKLEGVRGREAGAWSRMWSIMCSRTARWRLPVSGHSKRIMRHLPTHFATDLAPSMAARGSRWIAWGRGSREFGHFVHFWRGPVAVCIYQHEPRSVLKLTHS